MSKMTSEVKNRMTGKNTGTHANRVTNFMGGNSYELNAMDTLRMVSASSIFGEPQYYRDGQFAEARVKDGCYQVDRAFADYAILAADQYNNLKTSALMERIIDKALCEDFEGVLEWARVLRTEYNMRLNPQVIMVRAAMHPDRKAYTASHPGGFHAINRSVMSRADDVVTQLTYFLFQKGGKHSIPNLLKRSWADKLESLSRYELFKYRNHGIGLINTVRICHANNELINELMRTGTVSVSEDNKTWESLRAQHMPWVTILDQIQLPHMALLRNLRGIFKETDDRDLCDRVMQTLIEGVPYGKQFPFRYMSAAQAVQSDTDVHHAQRIIDGLEACLDKACDNLPRLAGRSAFLSDNSGSAWSTMNSEYGSVTIAEIDNLSAVIGAANSDEGYVFPFGNKLLRFEISKRQGILAQAKEISSYAGCKVGHETENGVWLFFDEAIRNRVHWDHIFIYSDMQAGHGGLYGTKQGCNAYTKLGCCINERYIDVAKLIALYRREVNPEVNVYCVQTAGYDNVLVPENGYRTSVLYGWTGRELVYADAMNQFWTEQDNRHNPTP